ncbi:hypothetical protein H8356DRAFT_1694214 [Neocallimastix lanati (nom. inval.)]|jgi:homocysteine S-methyltransferase|nr:hypothetical protein H8356DRAFT_1694214 [Neocallimastix sp. JGI-2020a]
MSRFKELLKNQDYLILHGPLGTELERQGYNVNGKLWSAKYLIKKPEIIEKIHETYTINGCDIITSSSYQATIPGLIDYGLSESEAEDIIRLSVKLAKSARDKAWGTLSDEERSKRPYPLISGDIGPYAAYLADGSEYTGKYEISKKALKSFHRQRIALLMDEGVDLLAVETIPNFTEVQAIAEILAEDYPDVESYFSFTTQDGVNIFDGTPIKEVAAFCDKYDQILAMGINCSAPTIFETALKEFAQVTKKPLVAYPSSGEQYDAETQTWKKATVSTTSLLDYAKQWHELGVKIVGGCCRTNPEDIKSLYQGLRGVSSSSTEKLPTIRRATAEDIPAINDLLAQVLHVHHVARPDLFKPKGNKFSDEELAVLLKNDECPVYVYVDENNKVRAHLFCEINEIKQSNLQPIKNLFIEDLCVDENARGKKIGKKLYYFAIDLAKKLGCHNLTLDAWYDNTNAYHFYERLGMKPQKTRFEQILN